MSDDLLAEFLVESRDNLDRLDRDLVDLEQDPRNRETLGRIFRTIHTIKGACGFLALSKLESISHVGESLLSRMRDGHLCLNAEITTGLLAMVDAIRHILVHVEHTGGEGDVDCVALVAELTRLNEGRAADPAAAPAPITQGASALHVHDPHEERRTGADRRGGAAASSSIRIDVRSLDALGDLIDELVLVRDQLLDATAGQTDRRVISATERLNRVTCGLQESVRKTRMQRVGDVWATLPRMVRDLAVQCRKQVRLELEGRDTALDKRVIEAIKDPLMHAVRNAVDHGIERPDVRLARGKPAVGRIRLCAFQDGRWIAIEVSDDGAGIDPATIRSQAIQRALISTERASRMPDDEVLRLILLPGISTAESVSHISGRGVGMDVVKTNIEKVGGRVDIQSSVGEGTTLRIRIPLALAILPTLRGVRGSGQALRHASATRTPAF
jgi:two-component system chemotaxis sensor kinase CheA